MTKKTVFAADEHLIVYGDFTVRGNTIFLNTVETVNQSDQYIINSDADSADSLLRLRANGAANIDLINNGSGNLVVEPGIQGNVFIPSGHTLTLDGTVVENFGNLTVGTSNTAISLETAREFSITGDVVATGINFDGTADVELVTTIQKDAVITLEGAIAGTGTMTNLGNVTITTAVDSLGIDYVRNVQAGAGLTKTGSLGEAQNVSIDVGEGDGITVSGDAVAVDSSVVRTSGTQTIAGTKQFTGNLEVITRAQGDNSVRAASTEYVDTALSNLLDGAPAALDTLNELAAALNDDANRAATVNSALAGKADANTVLTAGDGLSGGGDLSTDRSFAVDSTVIRTTGNQSLSGTKSFTGELAIPGSSSTTEGAIYVSGNRVYAYVNGDELELSPKIDVGTIEDVGASGIDVLAGSRQVLEGNANVTYYGIRSVSAGAGIQLGVAANVITITGRSDSNVRALFGVSNSSGFGNLSYNSSTGVITHVGTSNSDVRNLFSASGLINYNSGTGLITTSADNYDRWRIKTDSGTVHEVTSLGQIEVLGGSGISVTNSGNILTIASSTGADITAVTAGDGLSGGGTSGAVEIDVDSTVARTNTSETFDQDLTVQGNLVVNGTTFTVNSETLTVDDNIIVLNNNESGSPSQDAGIEIERGTSDNVQFLWDEASDRWVFTNDGSTFYPVPFSTSVLAEGTNLYFTNARARTALSASGDINYNSSTGVISFTERTDAEVRSLISATGDLSYNSGTGVISFSETYSTATELLTALLTVDGSSSNLDADLLDGEQGSYYRNATNINAGTLNSDRLPDLVVADFANSAIITSSESFTSSDSALVTAAVVNDLLFAGDIDPIFNQTIGFGNDDEVLRYNDANNEDRDDYWSSRDGFYIQGDSNNVNAVVLKTGYLDISQNAYISGKLGINTIELASGNTTLSTTSASVIQEWRTASIGSLKLVVQATSGGDRQVSELLITHNGNTAVSTEYASIWTDTALADYSVDISGSNVRLLATSVSNTSTEYDIISTGIIN